MAPRPRDLSLHATRYPRTTSSLHAATQHEPLDLAHAVFLHCMHYNFARPHKTLAKVRKGYPTTPGDGGRVAEHVWSLTETASLLD